jgi:hypothetical protein
MAADNKSQGTSRKSESSSILEHLDEDKDAEWLSHGAALRSLDSDGAHVNAEAAEAPGEGAARESDGSWRGSGSRQALRANDSKQDEDAGSVRREQGQIAGRDDQGPAQEARARGMGGDAADEKASLPPPAEQAQAFRPIVTVRSTGRATITHVCPFSAAILMAQSAGGSGDVGGEISRASSGGASVQGSQAGSKATSGGQSVKSYSKKVHVRIVSM